jgi:methylmalonyl-CoA mutase C-terminal domain/subunit
MSTENKQQSVRCIHVVARAFRDAGFEVIYSGLHKAPEEIVQAAVQEDVDVLGISILSGAHKTLVPKIMNGLEEYGAKSETLVLAGGVIPEEDRDDLRDHGIAAIFGPGTSIDETVEFIRENAPQR